MKTEHKYLSVPKIPITDKWRQRWLSIAQEVASWSKDPSTQVGAVLCTQENTPISFGYNGLPRGISDDDARLQNRDLKYKLTVHAEANAILNAQRSGARVEGSVLYCTHPPCFSCATLIIQAGISIVVYQAPSAEFAQRWPETETIEILKEAGILVGKN